MNRSLARLGVLLFGAGLVLSAGAAGGSAATTGARTVASLTLNGVVDPFMATYVDRGIAAANRGGDAAVLLTIDTPGGLDSSMRSIVKSILASRVPVICYTAPSGARAASAGTFIMLACPHDAMAPGTEIGAAHPVGVSGAIESEKVTNDAAAFIRSLALRWHRNAPWAVSAVRQATSASAEDALRLHVVDRLAPSARDALTAFGVPADTTIVPFSPSITERLFHSIADPNIAFLLVNIGFIALIVWVIHPAFHVSLAVGIVSEAIGLAILETLPVQLVGFILLVVAAVLFVLDVKAKAHGVLTAGGLATLILGGLLLFNPSVPAAHVSRPLIVVIAVAVALFTTFTLRALLAAREAPVRTGGEALVQAVGTALTDLAPRGRVRARGETWTAVSASPVKAGETVRIVEVHGVTLTVEPFAGVPVPSAPGPREGEPI